MTTERAALLNSPLLLHLHVTPGSNIMLPYFITVDKTTVYIYTDWAHLNAVFYKCQGEYFTTQNLQTINLSRSHLWWYLNKTNSVATSITVKLYLFGLFLGCFKGYAITADAENWVVYIYIYLNFNDISISTINICRIKQHPWKYETKHVYLRTLEF